MKLKDFLGKVVENKTNKQKVTTFKQKILKKENITPEDLLNMEVDFKLKKLLYEN